jgi:hypothetical protein
VRTRGLDIAINAKRQVADAARNIPRLPWLAHLSGVWLRAGGRFSNLAKGRAVPLSIGYLLLLIVLSSSVATAPIPTRVGHFHSLENCIAAANDAKATQPINPATFGFICVRDNDLPIARPR